MFSFLDVYIYIFMKSRKYLAINFSDSLSVPFSLFSPSRTTIENMLIYLIVSHRSLGCCLFFFTIFSFCSSDWLISIDLPSNSLILSSVYSNCFWNHLVIYYSYCTFQCQKFYLLLFYNFYIFIVILFLLRKQCLCFDTVSFC